MSNLQPSAQPAQNAHTNSVLEGIRQGVAQDLQNRSIQHQSVQHHSVVNYSQLNTSGMKQNAPVIQPMAAQHTSVLGSNHPGNVSVPLVDNPANRSQLNNSALPHNNSLIHNTSVQRSVQNRSVMNTSQPRPMAPPGTTIVTTTIEAIPQGLPPPPMIPDRISLIGQRVYSPGLKAIFWLSFLLLLTEMMVMMTKYHFLGVLLALTIMSLFFLRFFQSKFNKAVLAMIILSIILDVVWLIVKLQRKNSFNEFASPFAMVNPMVHLGVTIAIFFSLLLRVVLAVLIFGFTRVETGDAYYVQVFGYEMVMTQAVDSSGNHFNQAYNVYQPVIY